MANTAPHINDLSAALRNAQALEQAGKRDEARAALASILGYAPACLPALYNLGLFTAQRGDFREAESFFARAHAAAPQDSGVMANLAIARAELADAAGALALSEKIRAAAPTAEVLVRLGGMFRHAGLFEMAQDTLRAALKTDPFFVAAWFGLHRLKTFSKDDADIAAMERLHARAAQLPPDDRMKLEFCLGKAYLDAGDAAKAFAHFASGNSLKRATLQGFDIGQFESYIDNAIRLFDKGLVARLGDKGGVTGTAPIFIVGMPRSGSTLADQILSSHPDVTSIGEARCMVQSLPFFPNAEVPGFFAPKQASITQQLTDSLTPENVTAIGKRYLALSQAQVPGAKRIADKMLFNHLWVGMIFAAMPDAKIVHCTRDPADIALSLWQLLFPAGMPWVYDQRDIARYYLAYKKLMAHWNELYPGRIFEANYETMIANQETETRRLLDFCGLSFDESCLQFHQNARQVKTASATQVRMPIYKTSVRKWEKYRDHLGPLLETLEAGA
ncbi:MAG: sulfotransferase [Alphaproteobacteria bacterium]